MSETRKKIHKERVDKKETKCKGAYAERLRERLGEAHKITLDYVFTFGKYRDDCIKFVCDIDPLYIQWIMTKRILDLSKEVIDYYIQAQRKAREQSERAERERAEREQRERTERARAKRQAYEDAYSSNDFWQDAFRQSFNFGNRTQRQSTESQVSVKVVSPASQWDHLPQREKAGKILGLSGKITKEELKALYRKRMLEYHPDKVSCLGEELQKLAHEMSLRINEAYDYFKMAYDL